MKNSVILFFFCAVVVFNSCSLLFDDSKIEGKWWLSKDVSPTNTIVYDSKDKSTYQAEFKSDRTYIATIPATGDQSKGRWTIDTAGKALNIYYTTPSANTMSAIYDFPEYNILKMFNPTNSSYYIEFTRN